MSKTIVAVAAALILAGCAGGLKDHLPGAGAQSTGLQPQLARITDERILGDRETIEAVQQRLRKLNDGGMLINHYPWAKAQCWLDTAKTQYHENDRTGYVEEALQESVKIVRELEANKAARVGYETPHIAKSEQLRPDLWQQLAGLRGNETTLRCNALTVACSEIRLVRAGHALEQTGWRQATPHVQMVEDGIRRANEEAKACVPAVTARAAPQPVAPPPAPALPAPGPAPAPVVVDRETYVLVTDTLFVFDRGSQSHIVAGGQKRIDEIAARLRGYKSIDSVTVIGHTDRFGSDAYNDALSAQRARTVSAMLEKAGVKAAKFEAIGRGKREPVTTDCPLSMPRAAAIQCLQPDRRVTVEVRGIVR
jgi:OmpA-OmpF porin, OOP family